MNSVWRSSLVIQRNSCVPLSSLLISSPHSPALFFLPLSGPVSFIPPPPVSFFISLSLTSFDSAGFRHKWFTLYSPGSPVGARLHVWMSAWRRKWVSRLIPCISCVCVFVWVRACWGLCGTYWGCIHRSVFIYVTKHGGMLSWVRLWVEHLSLSFSLSFCPPPLSLSVCMCVCAYHVSCAGVLGSGREREYNMSGVGQC